MSDLTSDRGRCRTSPRIAGRADPRNVEREACGHASARTDPALGLLRALRPDGNTSGPLDASVGGHTCPVALRDRAGLGIGETLYLRVDTSHDAGPNVPVGNFPSLPVARNLADARAWTSSIRE